MNKILLCPSGGTAASMGAFMEYFVEKGIGSSDIWLVPESWRTMAGLTNRQVIQANNNIVSGWDCVGGSPVIPSCNNTNVFKIPQEDGSTKDMSGFVREFAKDYDGIIVVGGGGTTFQSEALHRKQELNLIVPLATMDNDICCFDNMLGFQTAVEHSAASISACCSDAQTMNRPTIIFAMGYECGRLAVKAVEYARGVYGSKIDMLHIPETGVAIDDVAAKIRKSYNGGAFTIVISEGVCKSTGTSDGVHRHFSTAEYAQKLMDLTGIKFKVLTPDYMQRSGRPVRSDRELALKFADEALRLVEAGEWNRAIGSINDEVVSKPFEEIIEVLENQNASSEWYSTPNVSLEEVKDILIK